MKRTTLTILLSVITACAFGQDTPTDISKSDLPAKAVCLICSGNGEGHGEEKPAGGLLYKGKAYYFCNSKEIAEFKKDPEGFVPPVLPRPAPKLSAKTLDGKTITLEDYKGKVVLVDFWATWCKPCIEAMPEIDKLHKELGSKGFVVLGVSIDEDTKKVGPFAEKRKFSYPLVVDNKETPSWAEFKVKGIPAMFLIDKKGQIVAQWKAKVDHKELKAAVEKALADE